MNAATKMQTADKMAEKLFGAHIYYDRELLVQTLDPSGHRLRPLSLPA